MTDTAKKSGGFRSTGRVTIKTVAKSLGLSPSTVSRALRNDPSVTEATTQRIRETAEALGYTRDLRGVNLRTGQTNAICALMLVRPQDEYGDPAAMQLIKGIISGMSGSDKTVVFRLFSTLEEQFAAMREMVTGHLFDGFILDHTSPQDERVKYLLEQDFPFVCYGRTELYSPHAYFDIDNDVSAYQSTRVLIERGRRRIALVTPPLGYLFAGLWLHGYQRALSEFGIPYDPALVAEAGMETRLVEQAVEQICVQGNAPDAFVCPNEVATTAVVRACENQGLDIENTTFISQDGTKFFDFFRPKVSSSYYSSFHTGEELSRMMLRLLNGESVEKLQVLVAPEIVSR